VDVKEEIGKKIEDAIRRHIRPARTGRRTRTGKSGSTVIGVINAVGSCQ
jgi:DNA-binding LacI/PurR family transcriptional regulator